MIAGQRVLKSLLYKMHEHKLDKKKKKKKKKKKRILRNMDLNSTELWGI